MKVEHIHPKLHLLVYKVEYIKSLITIFYITNVLEHICDVDLMDALTDLKEMVF